MIEAPTFRHTHFNGKQVVVHKRSENLHEIFSYNLYPGPSAKKGLYGALLSKGENEGWITAHCSTVQVVSPYDNITTFSGASVEDYLAIIPMDYQYSLLTSGDKE